MRLGNGSACPSSAYCKRLYNEFRSCHLMHAGIQIISQSETYIEEKRRTQRNKAKQQLEHNAKITGLTAETGMKARKVAVIGKTLRIFLETGIDGAELRIV